MAIQLAYYNIIIPIANLSKCREIDNLSGALKFYAKQGKVGCIWYDDNLFTIGGIMGSGDVENEVMALEKLGLNQNKKIDNESYWDDLCVVDFADGPTLPCSWLECHIDPHATSYAWFKGQEAGVIAKPQSITEPAPRIWRRYLTFISKLWK